MFGDGIKYICRICWQFIIDIKNRQQVSPSIPFASPWAKLNSAMDQELLQYFHASKVHRHSIKILLQIRINWSNFQTYPYYLQPWGFLTFTWVLSNWKIERSSQALCLKFFVSPLFQSFHCMTLSSLSIYVVFGDPHQGNKDVMPFHFLPLRLMWSS